MNNLKFIYITLTLVLVSSYTSIAYAQTSTPATTVSPAVSEKLNEKLNSQINKLKDKIASRVSELNLVEKRGITGIVSEVSTNKITLTDLNGKTKLVDIDEITKFSSSSAKGTFGLSDLTKGTKVNVLGLYNKQSKRILARFIRTAVNPVFLTGTIYEIDIKNRTMNIALEDKKTTKIDIIPTTKISTYSKDDGLAKILLTGINTGERVAIIGFPDKTDTAMIVAERVTVLPGLPQNPQISVSIVPPTPTAVPTVAARRSTLPSATPSVRRLSPTPTITR